MSCEQQIIKSSDPFQETPIVNYKAAHHATGLYKPTLRAYTFLLALSCTSVTRPNVPEPSTARCDKSSSRRLSCTADCAADSALAVLSRMASRRFIVSRAITWCSEPRILLKVGRSMLKHLQSVSAMIEAFRTWCYRTTTNNIKVQRTQ